MLITLWWPIALRKTYLLSSGLRFPTRPWEAGSGRGTHWETSMQTHTYPPTSKHWQRCMSTRPHTTPTNTHTSALQMDGKFDNGRNKEVDHWSQPSFFFDSYDLKLLREVNHIKVWRWTINLGQEESSTEAMHTSAGLLFNQTHYITTRVNLPFHFSRM